MSRQELSVEGMHCAACVGRVERALAAVPGVLDASVNLVDHSASLEIDTEVFEVEAATGAVDRAGYAASPRRSPTLDTEADKAVQDAERDREWDRAIRRFWVGALFGLPVVVLGHLGLVPGLEHLGHDRRLQVISGLLTIPIMTWVGGGFFTRAWKQLLRGESTMDTLIALGTGAAFLYSVVAVAAPGIFPEGTAHPFFEAAAVVITLVVLGQALEARARGKTSKALRALLQLRPDRAWIRRGGEDIEVDVAEVSVGDHVIIRPGARVPVDGEVIEGESEVDEALVTGESLPVPKQVGDSVIGGTINGGGALVFEARHVGEDTVLARIVDQVRIAQTSKPPIQRLADTIAGWFVPAVVVIAVVAGVVWFFVGPEPRLNFAVVVAVSVLVISCPCALGLATPISVMIGIGKGAERGILIRNGEALERARSIDTVVLDKTGTLTRGQLAVVGVHAMSELPEQDVLAWAAAAERSSEHPVARAIGEAAEGMDIPRAEGFRARPGRGVEATVQGAVVRVGTADFLRGEGVDVAAVLHHLHEVPFGQWTEQGVSWVLVSKDDRLLGAIGVADEVKSDAAEAVARLRGRGIEVVMLTGDQQAVARTVATRVGIDELRSRVLPEQKASVVTELQAQGRVVAMVGDGINDAPALAAADVGIAIGSGTDVAMEAADITLMGDRVGAVADALDLSEATVRNVRQNLFGAFIYNVLAIPLAAGVLYPTLGVLLSPMLAGAAMAFSSVTVVSNANRLRGWKPAV